jgi:hypothetical protein
MMSKQQQQTTFLVGLITFLCMIPMVAAFDMPWPLVTLLNYWDSLNFFYRFMFAAPIIFIIGAITGLE